jgi:hypothetical protein
MCSTEKVELSITGTVSWDFSHLVLEIREAIFYSYQYLSAVSFTVLNKQRYSTLILWSAPSPTEGGGYGGPAAERSSLLYYFIKRKRYISSRPPFLKYFRIVWRTHPLIKPDSAGAGKRRTWEAGPTSAASHTPHTIPEETSPPTTASDGGLGLPAPTGRPNYYE